MKKLKLFFLFSFLFTSTAVFAVDMSAWSSYGDSVQQCKAGTFNLPDPIQSAMTGNAQPITYQIVGMNDGACKMNITRNIEMIGQTKPTTMTLNCSIPISKLAILSKSAKDIASGTVTMSSNDPVSNILDSACTQAP